MAQITNCLDLAKLQVGLRALRYGHFPADIFDEYAWDMMLHLYIARLRDQELYIDNVVNLTSKNRPVGDRWVKHLAAEKMVEIDGEIVRLTEQAFNGLQTYHDEALAAAD